MHGVSSCCVLDFHVGFNSSHFTVEKAQSLGHEPFLTVISRTALRKQSNSLTASPQQHWYQLKCQCLRDPIIRWLTYNYAITHVNTDDTRLSDPFHHSTGYHLVRIQTPLLGTMGHISSTCCRAAVHSYARSTPPWWQQIVWEVAQVHHFQYLAPDVRTCTSRHHISCQGVLFQIASVADHCFQVISQKMVGKFRASKH